MVRSWVGSKEPTGSSTSPRWVPRAVCSPERAEETLGAGGHTLERFEAPAVAPIGLAATGETPAATTTTIGDYAATGKLAAVGDPDPDIGGPAAIRPHGSGFQGPLGGIDGFAGGPDESPRDAGGNEPAREAVDPWSKTTQRAWPLERPSFRAR